MTKDQPEIDEHGDTKLVDETDVEHSEADEEGYSQVVLSTYKLKTEIGSGSSGDVYEVEHRKTGERYAMKVVETNDNLLSNDLLREMTAHFEMEHENVVKLLWVHPSETHMFLVMELGESCLSAVIEREKIKPGILKAWLKQLLSAVEYLHQRHVIHRDIKPENILIMANEQLKLADFGSVGRVMNEIDQTPQICTLQFRAPEVLFGWRQYGTPIDIWSIGCTFAEMADQKALFGSADGKSLSQISIIHEIFKKLGTPKKDSWLVSLPNFPDHPRRYRRASVNTVISPNLDADGNDLLRKMLKLNPKKRISASAALKHSYFL